MLKLLRNKKTAKRIWIFLAIIIVPAFVLWGSGSLMRDRKEVGFAGKIAGRKVSLMDYRAALNAVKNQAIMRFGEKYSEIEKYLNLRQQAWFRLTLLYEAEKRKINASDKEIVELIQSYPFFQRKGRFDQKTYSEILQYVFHTQPRVFEEQIRQDIMLSKLMKEVSGKVSVTEEELKEEYTKLNEEISVYYTAALFSDFTKNIKPGEEELKGYFSENSLAFKQPLSHNLDYVATDSENKINGLAAALNKRVDFVKGASDYGLTVKETGMFNQESPIPGIGWSSEILNLVSKLKTGEHTPVIRADKNYYILKLKEKKEAYIPEFDQIKDKVKEAFVEGKAKEAAKDKLEGCLNKLKELYLQDPKSTDFNKAAKESNLKYDSTGLFKYGSYIEGIGGSDNFWAAARKLKEGEPSGIIETPQGLYIIKLKSKVPLDEKKFAGEKEEFGQRLLSQRQEEYFLKFTEELSRKGGIGDRQKQ